MRVSGYGLVIGLEGQGSGKCPQSVSEYLQKEIKRAQLAGAEWAEGLSVPELIRSPSSAAVFVQADIPPAVTKGTSFDVFVQAVDMDVKSLAGGRLLPCNLRLATSSRPDTQARVLARAEGHVFTNPFARGDAATSDADPRRGRILGGGRSTEDRRIQLITVSPSYSHVQQITRSVNTRFGGARKIADPASPTNIILTVPAAYRHREQRFLELVTHLPLAESALALEMRAKQLNDELARPNAPYEDVALGLEAIGASVIPLVRKHYAHRQRATSFYAARVGARLGDDLATEVLAQHATDKSKSPYQYPAIEELGDIANSAIASGALRSLLDHEDPRVRIEAYEALRKQDGSAVRSMMVGRDNFVLDVVDSNKAGLIYARRTGEQRIAIFGRFLKCRPPLLYSRENRPVTVSAHADQDHVVVLRKSASGRQIWDPVRTSPAVSELVRVLGDEPDATPGGEVKGLGLSYVVILDVLSALCESGGIPADFRMEQVGADLGPAEPLIRPESDEL